MPVVGPTTTFGFDGRGSRTSSTVAATQSAPAAVTSFGYTASGALASVVMPTTTVNYTSDARNLRQSRTVAGDTDLFTWSSVGGLPLLLDDGAHSYLYGPSSSPVAQVDDVTGVVQYLHADLLGTPRLVTDAGGAVAGTVSYDAFGNRSTYTGTQSAIGFTGNWTDPDTGLLYLRAGDYDPATGQFLTVDPAVDSTRQPYAYTGNNPVSRTDPSGLDAGEELLSGLYGVADGLSGGLSSAFLSAVVPGYDCFIQAHNTAFQVGSIVAQVAVAVVTIVGTAGAGAILIAAKYAAVVGIKVAVKAGLKEAERLIVSTAKRLASDDAGFITIGPRLPAAPRGPVGRYEVGAFKDLKARSTVGDDLDIHHVPQSHPAQQSIPGYSHADAPSIALPRNEHAAIPNLRGPYSGTAGDLIAQDIEHLREFTSAPESAINDLIALVNQTYPGQV